MTKAILATSNGTGMGHLSRQTSIGLAMEGLAEPVLFSLSTGLPMALTTGIDGEYCPSYTYPYLNPAAWNEYLRDRLVALIHETNASVVAFDGIVPYLGIGLAALETPEVAYVWLRRGLWRRESKAVMHKSGFFDLVIEPNELVEVGSSPNLHSTNTARIPPVSLAEVIEPLSRAEARTALNLPADGPVALVSLGSGQHGDTSTPKTLVSEIVLNIPDFHVATTRLSLADTEPRAGRSGRTTEITDTYPLVKYLAAFDLAICSAGYNQVHELVPLGVPALYIANTSTRSDDQVLRGRRLAELGYGLFAPDNDPAEIERQVTNLLNHEVRASMSKAAKATRPAMKGASVAAELIAGAKPGDLAPKTKSVGRAQRREKLIHSLESVLGHSISQGLRKRTGRYPRPAGDQRPVTFEQNQSSTASEPPLVTVSEELSMADLRSRRPIEHARTGSSPDYLLRRLEIVTKYYRTAD